MGVPADRRDAGPQQAGCYDRFGEKPRASSRVSSAAPMALQPLAFWPAQSGEKSPLPWLSALARKGAMAAVARGKPGATGLIGPSSRISRLTIPRAGRPLNRSEE